MPRERSRITRARNREPAHRDAVYRLDAGPEFVRPGDIVLRARGEHLDLGMASEVFGNVARMQLGATIDVGAVSLRDDRNLHDTLEPESPGGSTLRATAGLSVVSWLCMRVSSLSGRSLLCARSSPF